MKQLSQPLTSPALVMGILNLTPDSFSDGGVFNEVETALERAETMVAAGAAIIDIGGESTRPGAEPVAPNVEQARILPVVEALAQQEIFVSVDTYHAETARAAVKAGAKMVNDISGGKADPRMFSTVAELGCEYVLQHWRGDSQSMHLNAHYQDTTGEVCAELQTQLAAAITAGIKPERIILDPGFGFAKDSPHNWELLAHLDEIINLGQRVLVGVSRKRFVADVVRETRGEAAAANMGERDGVSAMIATVAALSGVWAVRAHEVVPTVQALNVAAKIRQARRR